MNLIASTSAHAVPYEDLLKKPLITGASVSADYGSPSPGKRLASRYTGADSIRTIAFPGRPGREIIKSLAPDKLRDRTSVLAVDFFFWDSTLADPAPSLEALRKMMSWVEKAKLPIVLGQIPELLPGRQPQRARLNEALRKACESYPSCYLMPFDRLHREIVRNGSLTIKGSRYSLKALVPDGLHLSDTAGNYLADVMEDLLSGRRPRVE